MSMTRKSRENTIDISQAGISGRQILSLMVSAGLAAIIVAAVHWPALSAGALSFDDNQYLTENHLVQNPGWNSIRQFVVEVLEPSTVRGYYHPLSMISLMLDYARGGRSGYLAPFRQTSLLLHIINTVLVIIILYLLFGRILVATLSGLLFGLHPLNVESIPWLAERKTLLAAFFVLLCLILYIIYTRKRSRTAYGASVALYILALTSKPTAVPLPALLLLLDYWPLRRISKKVIAEKIPFFVLAGIAAFITFISQRNTSAVTMPSEYGFMKIPLMICHNIIFYLHNFVWPTRLSAFYPFPEPFSLRQPTVLAGVIGTFILITILLFSLRWTRSFLSGWLFFLLAVFPTLGIVGFHPVIAADRHMYLPMVGLMLPIAWLLRCVLDAGDYGQRRLRILAVILTVATLAVGEATVTRRYLVHWQDTISHYKHLLSLAPGYAIIHNNLGVAYYEQGKSTEAIRQWETAVKLAPDYPDALNNLAWMLATSEAIKSRDAERAIKLAEHAYQLSEKKPAERLDTLAVAYAAAGQFDKAVQAAQKAMELAFKAKRTGLANEISNRLELYKNRKAYREPQ